MPTTTRKKKTARKGSTSGRVTAETLAKGQREISVSEFFAKNRHLLGFDNPRKALLTAVKEAVDNALDACEEAGILPDIHVRLLQKDDSRFKLTIRDNGPGIVRSQIESIFGKLLYGSKFHRMKMSRGQQGIGISAAGMYGLMTTGKPVHIVSKTSRRKPPQDVVLKIDTSKNRAEVVSEKEDPKKDSLFPGGTGTQVMIELEGRYQKGRQSIDEYLEQTAIANPHAQITWVTPTNETIEFPRAVEDLPDEAKEIKPHPKGIELGTLIQMLERTESKSLSAFLQDEFSRVGQRKASELAKTADKLSEKTITPRTRVSQLGHAEAECLYKAIQEASIMAPPTDCLVPIGSRALLAGLLKEVQAEFFAAATRPPTVYRGNPFQMEVAIAFGGNLGADESARILRFANRVPLLYQQSACSSFKAVVETSWKNYGLAQPRNSLPVGPLVVLVHMASVWVPFTSESKEAIADYDEIRKEMKLALQECGRKLGTYLRRRKQMRKQSERRGIFERYIGEIATSCHAINGTDPKKLYDALLKQAAKKTKEADQKLDLDGKVVAGKQLEDDEDVIILSDRQVGADDAGEDLFGGAP
ncbi:MAG: DNA topoisomerase VI subunit B, partial [Planctomycetota bacterium]|nr:DNA topoisomerase VI subunit B [Planctomycetota bacterium]